jgi:hypothetical protein
MCPPPGNAESRPSPQRPSSEDPLYGDEGQRRPLTRAERMIGVRHMLLGTVILLALLFTLALCSLPR